VHNAYYTSIGEAHAPSHGLCGTLHFAETAMATAHHDSDWMGGGQTLFPAFSLPVVAVSLKIWIAAGDTSAPLKTNVASPLRAWPT
jgi:hypothetical protein